MDLIALVYSGIEILWYMVGNYSALPILVKMMRVFVVGRLLRGFRLPIFNKGVDVRMKFTLKFFAHKISLSP